MRSWPRRWVIMGSDSDSEAPFASAATPSDKKRAVVAICTTFSSLSHMGYLSAVLSSTRAVASNIDKFFCSLEFLIVAA